MSSPLPPDPYAALGVPSTADLATIRSAHRKLVLKFHPDRIRDEAERENGKLEFQKVQQAYELLADEGSRERYDNKLKLAELQRERFAKEAARPSPTSYSSRPSPPLSTVRKETRSDGRKYEERAPPADYFDSRDHYDELLPRSTSKKYDSYEKKPSPAPKSTEKKEKSSWARYMAPEGVPIRVAINLKARATEARERTKEYAQSRELKDRERRKERTEKTFARRPVLVTEEHSSSESDTAVPNCRPSKSSKTLPSRTRAATESDSRVRASPPRRRHEDGFDSREEHEKWERHHQLSRDYIAQSQNRPDLARKGSDADHFWEGDVRGGRRSGDDSDRKPSSSRRTAADDRRTYPSMPSHTSAPNNLRPHIIEREPVKEPQRSKTAAYPSDREHRRESHAPGLSRSQTMPVPRAGTRDGNAPAKGSNLKHAESQQDSGYSSNSTPHTPEMRGDSPIRETPRQPARRQTSTKYAIVEPESDEETSRRPRLAKVVSSDEDRSRRYRSPDPVERRTERRPERPRLPKLDTDTRSRSARVQEVRASMPRGDFAAYESASPRHSPTFDHHKGFFGEIPRDDREREPMYSYRPDPAAVRSALYRSPSYASHRNSRDVDDAHTHGPSAFRPSMYASGRRSSATAH